MKRLTIFILLILSITSVFSQHSGQQAVFNATSNSYIDYGKGINLNGYYSSLSNGSAMTITLWVKWDKKTTTGVGEWANLFTLADSIDNGDVGVFWIQHSQTNNKFEFALNTQTSGRQYIQSSTNPVEGVWYHIACVYDASLPSKNTKLYVNGVLEASNNSKGNIVAFNTKSKLNVGRWPNPANSYRRFNGMIDEISVWSKALTVTEINNIMNNPESITGKNYDASKLIGYYNFDTGTPADLTNSGNNGVNAGAVTYTNTLPVELVSFDVVLSNGNPEIHWATASETNNHYFTIERSLDGVNAETVTVVNGAGNSNSIINYQVKDQDKVTGIVYYRIKQTDFDGTTETFEWKAINLSSKQEQVLNVYPNPTNGIVNITLSEITSPQTTVTILDITGRQVFTQQFEANDYFNTSIDLSSNMPSGIYFIEVKNDAQQLIKKVILK
jgi:hypothetical protein